MIKNIVIMILLHVAHSLYSQNDSALLSDLRRLTVVKIDWTSVKGNFLIQMVEEGSRKEIYILSKFMKEFDLKERCELNDLVIGKTYDVVVKLNKPFQSDSLKIFFDSRPVEINYGHPIYTTDVYTAYNIFGDKICVIEDENK